MNSVQPTYAPPRTVALILGVVIFVVYHLIRRPALLTDTTQGDPLPLVVAIAMALIMGYGLTMLGWLIRRTKGQVWFTFRPTRGRIFGAFFFAMAAPLVVFSYLPWVVAGLVPFVLFEAPLHGIGFSLAATAIAYPLAAMIVRHTYERRLLRFGLFCLSFWTAYAGHLLWSGEMVFRL